MNKIDKSPKIGYTNSLNTLLASEANKILSFKSRLFWIANFEEVAIATKAP